MISFSFRSLSITIRMPKHIVATVHQIINKHALSGIMLILILISCCAFYYFLSDGTALAYNDARSHLNIGRRVVEGLSTGLAQLGSVWLPLPHLLMVPTIWVDIFWRTGFSGAIQSMLAFLFSGVILYKFLELLRVGMMGRFVALGIFVLNVNILYMQSVAMTELLLIATMTAGVYYLVKWYQSDWVTDLIKSAFFIMLSTLIRYDGWFLLIVAGGLVFFRAFFEKGKKHMEGSMILFSTMAGVGIVLWFLWNLLIFGDPLYFAFGPFSAKAQQDQLEAAGVLATKHDLWFSLTVYLHAVMYNSNAFLTLLGAFGVLVFIFDRSIRFTVRIASLGLLAPFAFNVLALYLGHSVLFVQGLSGDTWFNVRYGLMLAPAIAIFIGYIAHRFSRIRLLILGLCSFVILFSFLSFDAVTIDDALIGSSGKNVSEVSGWLKQHVPGKKGYVLISAASHDAIIFSSGLPMSRFIHEGTGSYWKNATIAPDRWARWIVMRTNDLNDLTFKAMSQTTGFSAYEKVQSFPFADIYELKPEYLHQLQYFHHP